MKIAYGRIVQSSAKPGLLSLRGPDGIGNDVRFELSGGGFKADDDVVILPVADYERLQQFWEGNRETDAWDGK